MTKTSAALRLVVDTAPTVALRAPANLTRYAAPAVITLAADVADSDGSIAKVQFFNGSTLLATVTTPPYTHDWQGVAKGSYTLRARATDNLGVVTTSEPVTVQVGDNVPPMVSMLATPTNATAPATVLINAAASDADGRVTKVEFFNGSTLLASLTQAPYAYNWMNVAAGGYTITAKATDDKGAVTVSEPATVTVETMPAAAQVYYIDSDHLYTPRAITNANNNIVWEWDNSDPFGGNLPEDDPGNTGNRLEFNLRFPGQYFDRETGLHYNYFRTYDPSTGRYIESDPIGVLGGVNTYAYVEGNPAAYVDPLGLWPIPDRDERVLNSARPRLPKAELPKPEYEINPAHLPGRNPKKTLLPSDAEQVYKGCIPDSSKGVDSKGFPNVLWGKNSDGNYYRYGSSNDGKAHYNGTYSPKDPQVPKNVRSLLDSIGGAGGENNTFRNFINY